MRFGRLRRVLLFSTVCIVICFLLYKASINYGFSYVDSFNIALRLSIPIDRIKERKIFLLETFGSSALTHRQSCAVESAARSNPNMAVVLLMTPPQGINLSHPLMDSLLILPNIYIKQLNIEEFISDTLLGEWFRSGVWKGTKWENVHISDAVKLLLIWKYGGIYIDLDTVTLRSLEALKNTLILESSTLVAFFTFVFDINHEFLSETLHHFAHHYSKTTYANGPIEFTKSFKKYYGIASLTELFSNSNITVLPEKAGFPFYYPKWRKYFEPNEAIDVALCFNLSYFFHLWNYLSKDEKLIIGENSFYEQGMQQRCPDTYSYAKKLKFV